MNDLDFEEVSLLRERSEVLKTEYKQYLVAHPDLTTLLSDLVNSCLVHKPDDIFDHVGVHFGAGADMRAGPYVPTVRAYHKPPPGVVKRPYRFPQ